MQNKVKHGGASKVPITTKTIHAFRSALSKYKAMKDTEKRAEEEKRKNEEKQKEKEKWIKFASGDVRNGRSAMGCFSVFNTMEQVALPACTY